MRAIPPPGAHTTACRHRRSRDSRGAEHEEDHRDRRRRGGPGRRVQDQACRRRGARGHLRARREGRPSRRQALDRRGSRRRRRQLHRRRRLRLLPHRQACRAPRRAGSSASSTKRPAPTTTTKKTFIVKNGRLVEMPDGIMMFAPTKIVPMATTRLYSWPAKFRMALDLVIPRKEQVGRRRDVPSSTTRAFATSWSAEWDASASTVSQSRSWVA